MLLLGSEGRLQPKVFYVYLLVEMRRVVDTLLEGSVLHVALGGFAWGIFVAPSYPLS